jgi:hypothetical protein
MTTSGWNADFRYLDPYVYFLSFSPATDKLSYCFPTQYNTIHFRIPSSFPASFPNKRLYFLPNTQIQI